MRPTPDVVILGAGHNGLVASILLAQKGLRVLVLEERERVGGACVTEYPFRSAPKLGCSTGAYLLGLTPPELLQRLEIKLPLLRRDPHYFLPTTADRYLLFGSNQDHLRQQFVDFFSEDDWTAHQTMNTELADLRDDLAPAWLRPPLSIEETAERFVRKPLRQGFIQLCKGSVGDYLDRFGFRSDLVKAMYAVTDAFSGLDGGYRTPGTGMNFLVHNMCRLPGSGGTWMIVEGGMGTVTQALAKRAAQVGVEIRTGAPVAAIQTERGVVKGVALKTGEEISARVVLCNADPFRTLPLIREDLPTTYRQRVDRLQTEGTTFKANLCLTELPRFRCLSGERQPLGATIHLLPDEEHVLEALNRAYSQVKRGLLPEFPAIEWYIHTAVDRSLQDREGRHSSALFVQWVPHSLSESTWEREESRFVARLLAICDRFAPGTTERVQEVFALTPPKIEQHFGISFGHIHHVDNKYGFADRLPYQTPIQGLYFCSAGCHPAGSVIGAAGHNAAQVALEEMSVVR